MGKVSIILAAALLMLQVRAFAVPVVKDAGVSAGNYAENRMLDARTSWMSQPEQWMVFWAKIDPKSDLDGDSRRFYSKVEFISPDNTLKILDGPFAFDDEGTAKIFKTSSFFANASTPEVPRPFAFGRWTVNFYVFDEKNGESVMAKTINFEMMESRALAPAAGFGTPEAGAVSSPEPFYMEIAPAIEKTESEIASETEIKKLKAELSEIKKMLETKVSKKPKAKSVKKKAPKKS